MRVGERVGARESVGLGVGSTDGKLVGEGLGIREGLGLGIRVVGNFVGLGVGKLEGI